jgi:hypothetical protein
MFVYILHLPLSSQFQIASLSSQATYNEDLIISLSNVLHFLANTTT